MTWSSLIIKVVPPGQGFSMELCNLEQDYHPPVHVFLLAAAAPPQTYGSLYYSAADMIRRTLLFVFAFKLIFSPSLSVACEVG